MISVELPFCEMLFFRFSVATFLAHTSNKLKQIKTFVQCSLLEKLPWNASVVGMSHERWPHVNFTRFWKNNLGYIRLPRVKVFSFLGHCWPRIPMVNVFVFWVFLVKVTNGEIFCFFLVIFGEGYQRWKFLFFWPFLAKDTNSGRFGWSWSFLAKDTNGESFGGS